MAITHVQAQKRLQKLCDDNGVDGIRCRVCGKMIYPPNTVGNHKVTPPETYHYIAKGDYKYFVHKACLKR